MSFVTKAAALVFGSMGIVGSIGCAAGAMVDYNQADQVQNTDQAATLESDARIKRVWHSLFLW